MRLLYETVSVIAAMHRNTKYAHRACQVLDLLRLACSDTSSLIHAEDQFAIAHEQNYRQEWLLV